MTFPHLGYGLGLRTEHYSDILDHWPQVDWFEIVSENYMTTGGRPLNILQQVRERYPLVMHGVSLSIGSIDPLNKKYLERLHQLAQTIEPALISDHLCWSSVDEYVLHDLLPLPWTEEALEHIVRRVIQVQDFLKRPILLENVSSYIQYKHSVLPEWTFLNEVAKQSGCGILLDLNNIYVNAVNHQFDPCHFIDAIDTEKVGYFHLAGHASKGSWLFDTHDSSVTSEVWKLYAYATKRFDQTNTLIEWDENIPPFATLLEEIQKAKQRLGGSTQHEANSMQPEEEGRGKREEVRGGVLYSQQPIIHHAPPTLANIQHWMRKHVYHQKVETPVPIPELENYSPNELQERLGAYQHGYPARIKLAIEEVFEAVTHVMGKKTFEELVHDYAASYPSKQYNLSLAGEHFAYYLKQSPIHFKLPFLSDLALLEWKAQEAFHAHDQKPIDPPKLQNIPPEDWEFVKFIFQPSIRLVESEWPILDVWEARKDPIENFDINMTNRGQKIVISRNGYKVRLERVDALQFYALQELLEGKTLGQMCETLSRRMDATEWPLQEWFHHWMTKGFIIDIQVQSEVPS